MAFRVFSEERNTQKFLELFEFEEDATVNVRLPSWESWKYINKELKYTNWKIKITEVVFNHIKNLPEHELRKGNLTINCNPTYVTEFTDQGNLFLDQSSYKTGIIFTPNNSDGMKKFYEIVLPGINKLREQFPEESIELTETVKELEVIKIEPMDKVEIKISFDEKNPYSASITFCGVYAKNDIPLQKDSTAFIWNLLTPIIIKSKGESIEGFLVKRYIDYVEETTILNGAEPNNNPLIKALTDRFNTRLQEFCQDTNTARQTALENLFRAKSYLYQTMLANEAP